MDKRVFFYLPTLSPAPSLEPLLAAHGAVAVLDLAAGRASDLDGLLEGRTTPAVVRVDVVTDEILRTLARHAGRVDLLILDVRQVERLGRNRFAALGVPYAFEVYGPADVLAAHAWRPRFLVARGHEGGGAVSAHTSLVLHQFLRARSYIPWVVKGGVDIPSARAFLQTGATGVAIDAAVWGFDEFALERRAELDDIGENDTIILDDGTGRSFRFFAKSYSLEAKYLREISYVEPENFARRLKMLSKELLIVGLDAHWARRNKERHGSLEAYLQTLSGAVAAPASHRSYLGEGQGVARTLGTRVPILQGPMARISENVAFAAAVEKAGAMPFIALSRLDGAATRAVLTEARSAGLRHGVGLLGLNVDSDALEEQLAVLADLPPLAAVVAAPTPELVERLTGLGVLVYAHTPTVGSFTTFFDQGHRRFVLEGCEAGGHIGIQTSVVLWQNILDAVRSVGGAGVELVFAGGVGSRTAVDFAEALVDAYGLGESVAFGIQVGTAYLATHEIVASGAMANNYRRLVLERDETIVTGETLNLRVRQVKSEYARGIVERERELVRRGLPLRQRKETFERENIGNLSKAVYSVDGDEAGSYMAGDGIVLMDRVTSVEELHRELTSAPTPAVGTSGAVASDEPIAVVGLGCIMPGARTPVAFFDSLLRRRVFIREVPPAVWDPAVFWSPDREAPYRTYSKIGAFVDDVDFPNIEFKIPPRVAAQMDQAQKWVLMAARDALRDAGLFDRPVDHSRTGVVIANSMGGELNLRNIRAIDLFEFRTALGDALTGADGVPIMDDEARRRLDETLVARLAPVDITEDTLPGELSNVIAGRVAAVFDFHGPNLTVDAACGSGLAAIMTSVGLLRSGATDLMVTGGVDTQMGPSSYVKFSKVGALSDVGSYPFDARASGFVMGEGCAVFVLKRFRDAVRDGDAIYALIRGVGASSDGKGKAIAAPNPLGQAIAVRRALAEAHVRPEDVAFVETHGTGTPAGDPAELETYRAVFAERSPADPVLLGSLKANVGHLRAAAGAAGLLKAILCVNQRVVPPQAGFDKPCEAIRPGEEPFAIVTEQAEIDRSPAVAGVSSFGFGGTNFHLVVAESPVNSRRVTVVYPQPRFTRAFLSRRLRRAFVFPGQSAQYVNMLVELRGNPVFESFLERADRVYRVNHGETLTDFIYPSADVVAEQSRREHRELLLQNTIVAQPAILAVSAALLEILRERGVEADLVFGHSLGEYTALYAAGVVSFEDVVDAVTIRGKYMTALAGDDLGTMAFVAADRAAVERELAAVEGYVVAANVNSPDQTIISGATAAVDAAIARFEAAGVMARRLPVSAAFHSKIVERAAPLFRTGLEKYSFHKARIPVSSNIDARFYPLVDDGTLSDDEAASAIRDRLAQHVYSQVDFVRQVQRAHDLGVREFVEVGPKNILTRLVQANLSGRPVTALYCDHPKESTLERLERVVEELRRAAPKAPNLPSPSPSSSPSSSAPPPAPRKEERPEQEQKKEEKKEEKREEKREEEWRAELPSAARLAMLSTVRAVVAKVSGYPPEMLDPDADFEGDLGIDTIKIFEVFTRLREHYPAVKGKRRTMSELTTMSKVVDYLAGLVAEDAAAPAAASEATNSSSSSSSSPPQQTERSAPVGGAALMRHRLRPYVTLADRSGGESTFLRTPGERVLIRRISNEAYVSRLAAHVEGLGHRVEILDPTSVGLDEAGVTALGARHDGPTVLLWLVEVGSLLDGASMDEALTSLFVAAKAHARTLRSLVVVTDADGGLGQWRVVNEPLTGRPSPAAAACSSLASLTMALGKDMEGVAVQYLDGPGFGDRFDPEALVGAPSFDPRHPVEGWSDRDTRVRFALIPEDLPVPVPSPMPEPVRGALVTGGGRGLGLLTVQGLVERGVPRVLVLGRSPEPPDEFVAAGLPADRVTYAECDVTDAAATARVVGDFLDGGPLDVVVHAAGVEVSRSLGRKTVAEFRSVLAVKVHGALNVVAACAARPPRLLVSFSSVAGLFGNQGQTDYAAGNGFLDALHPPGVERSLVLAWGPWAETGMASRGPIAAILKASDVTLVRPSEGVPVLFDEVARSFAGPGAIHAVVGVFGSLGEGYEPRPFNAVVPAATEHVHSLPREAYLADHSIKGRCYLPGAVGLAEFLESAGPRDADEVTVEDLCFDRPLKLGRTSEVTTRVLRDGERAVLLARRRHPSGEMRTSAHFGCRIRCVEPSAELLRRDATELSRIKGMLEVEECPVPLTLRAVSHDEMYSFFFHGPTFRVIRSFAGGSLQAFACTVADEPLNLPGNGLGQCRRVPYYVEAALHACGLHCLCTVASPNYVLPHRIDRMVVRHDRLATAHGATVHVAYLERGQQRMRRYTLRTRRYNAVVADDSGVPLVALYGIEMIEGQEAPERRERLIITGVPFELRDQPVCTVAVDDGAKLLADDGALGRVLSPEERSDLTAVTPERRRSEWAAGRLAAKLLVRSLLRRLGGVDLDLCDIVIRSGGRPPTVSLVNPPDAALPLMAGLRLSIGHGGDFASAAARLDGHGVGVDVEAIRTLDAAMVEDFTTPQERELASSDGERVALWALKECCVKATGEGLSREPRDFALESFDFNGKVTLVDRVSGRCFDGLAIFDGLHVLATARQLDKERT